MFRTNPDIDKVLYGDIVEWDIKAGNLSMIKEYNLLSKDIISSLSSLQKEERNIKVGLLQREDKSFAKELEKSFDKAVNSFIDMNNLSTDDIISIKRDAVFVKNHDIKYPKLSDNITFIPKNKYTHYVYLKPYEFYIKNNKEIDVKGLSDDLIPLHINGVLKFIIDVCNEYDINERILYIKEFLKCYNNLELPFDNYREFNSKSGYNILIDSELAYLTNIDESLLSDQYIKLDISYNLLNILLPLAKLFI